MIQAQAKCMIWTMTMIYFTTMSPTSNPTPDPTLNLTSSPTTTAPT